MSILIVRRGLQGNRGLTGLAAAETITLVNNLTSVVAVAGSIANVNTVAGSIANVNTVAGSISNVNLAGGSISAINTAAANIAEIVAAPGYASTTTANKNACEAAAAQAIAASNGMKYRSARAASTANVTSLSGTQTIDGVVLAVGDRVLLKDQSTTANNGIYVVAAGAWSRASDMDTWNEVVSTLVVIEEGAVNADLTYLCTSNVGGTLGTTAITFIIWQAYIGAGAVGTSQLANTSVTLSKMQNSIASSRLLGSGSSGAGSSYSEISVSSQIAFSGTVLGLSTGAPTWDSSGNLAIGGYATAATQANGDNTQKVATTAFVTNMSLGQGQTWQNMTGSRALGTTYTNNTGRSIVVNIEGSTTAVAQKLTLTTDGQTFAVTSGAGSGSSTQQTIFVIRAGGTYSVSVVGGSSSIIAWMELR